MNEIFRTAETRYGVVTRRDLREHGLSDGQIERRIGARQIEVPFPGVYRVVGSVPTLRQRAFGACVWLGPSAAVSHGSGAELQRIEAIKAVRLHVSVLVDVRRRSRAADITIHRVEALPARDIRRVDGIPCTSAARTLADCAWELDDEALEAAFESARRMGLTTANVVRRTLNDLGPRPGAASLRRVLDAVERRPAESRLEVKLSRLLRASKLPPSVPQFVLGEFRLDRAWPEKRVGVEADGFQHHGRRLQWKRDRRRIPPIEAMGWRVIHVTWDDVTREPAQTLDRVAQSVGNLAG